MPKCIAIIAETIVANVRRHYIRSGLVIRQPSILVDTFLPERQLIDKKR